MSRSVGSGDKRRRPRRGRVIKIASYFEGHAEVAEVLHGDLQGVMRYACIIHADGLCDTPADCEFCFAVVTRALSRSPVVDWMRQLEMAIPTMGFKGSTPRRTNEMNLDSWHLVLQTPTKERETLTLAAYCHPIPSVGALACFNLSGGRTITGTVSAVKYDYLAHEVVVTVAKRP